jgi:hypothetical protein
MMEYAGGTDARCRCLGTGYWVLGLVVEVHTSPRVNQVPAWHLFTFVDG